MTSDGKVVLVTGATSGIGLALVERLRDCGYRPVLSGKDPAKVERLAAEAGVPGYPLEVSREQNCAALATRIEAEVGPLWGLVNNAGIWLEGAFEDYSLEQVRRVVEVNTLGTIFMTHAALPHLLARGQGAVVNVVSTGALYCRKSISVYSASKWAVRGFTGCLEAECAPKGVRVMGFYPGKVATEMYNTAGIDRDLSVAMAPAEAAAMIELMLSSEGLVWSQVGGRSIRDYV
ncbi:MAG: SDR family oxidoreductase [Pseudomonadota bacterium]